MRIILATLVFLSPLAQADFGEIDLLVRESIEREFEDMGFGVDLKRLEYHGEPDRVGRDLVVRSSVWGEQRQIAPYWGWYECTTTIQVREAGVYRDLGSECWFEVE